MTQVVTPTGAIAPQGLPAAAGGVDVAGALTSVVPGIRKLKKVVVSDQIPANGGKVQLKLPKSSYVEKAVIKITGELRIKQGAEAKAITKVDPRKFIERVEFALSGSTNPRVLTGLQHDIIDNLDIAAVAANQTTYEAATGANNSDTKYPFATELSPFFVVSPQNLYGIPYLGAQGTVPELTLTFGNPDGTLATKAAAGPTIELVNGLVEVEMWRIDLPGPVMPQRVVQQVNGNTVESEIPGQGLYHEASYILLTRMFDAEDLTAAGTIKKFRLPTGPDYLRIVLLAYKGGALDDETAPLLDHADLTVQQATSIESKKIWQFENEYRRLYSKTRPKGVYVFSGIDETGTDSDLYVSRELGNFDLEVFSTQNAPGENSRYEVVTQELLPLSSPGQYL